jgi:hypothetical protein
MESRVRKLEETVAIIATDVAVIKSNYATKQDMAGVRTEIVEVKLEIAELRTEVREVKADVASIKENYATKADVLAIRGDLYQALNKQTKMDGFNATRHVRTGVNDRQSDILILCTMAAQPPPWQKSLMWWLYGSKAQPLPQGVDGQSDTPETDYTPLSRR